MCWDFLVFQCIEAFDYYIANYFLYGFYSGIMLRKVFPIVMLYSTIFSSTLILFLLRSLIHLKFIWHKEWGGIYFIFLSNAYPLNLIHLLNSQPQRGVWVAQLFKWGTPEFGSGHDLRVVGWYPCHSVSYFFLLHS